MHNEKVLLIFESKARAGTYTPKKCVQHPQKPTERTSMRLKSLDNEKCQDPFLVIFGKINSFPGLSVP